jgi:hypothetical protein
MIAQRGVRRDRPIVGLDERALSTMEVAITVRSTGIGR